uniref:Uncharacterized protein n=1 Tax=Homalodisca liturata TaxID=320908 RepID=A0A1B6II13_9HEMI
MASRKHELFDQDINELLGSEFSELSDSDDESDVDIFSRVRSGDFIFSELVRDADFNHDLGYLDEPVPGPSGDTVYSNNRPNKPTLDSVDLVINEVVQNYNPRNDFTGNEGTECRPNPKRRKLPPITYPWVNDTNFIPHIFPFDSSKSGINADSGISKESTNLDFFLSLFPMESFVLILFI